MRGKILILVLISLIIVTCNKKYWDNPHDENTSSYFDWSASITSIKQEEESIVLEFDCDETNFDSYVIERSLDNGVFSKVASPTKTVNSWTDNNITLGGKLHKYKIYAEAGSNSSNYDEAEIVAYLPPKFSASITQITYYSFSWKIDVYDNGGAPINHRYNIYYKEEDEKLRSINVSSRGEIPISGTLSNNTMLSIKASTVYYIQFEIINNQNKKGLSEFFKITTKDEP